LQYELPTSLSWPQCGQIGKETSPTSGAVSHFAPGTKDFYKPIMDENQGKV
jgi:hypothetical protein